MNLNNIAPSSSHEGDVKPNVTKVANFYPEYMTVHLPSRDGQHVPILAKLEATEDGVTGFSLMTSLSPSSMPEEKPVIVTSILVDPATGHLVLVQTDITDPANPVTTYWDINAGAAWTGDSTTLETPKDTDYESDAETFCDNGTEFLRWFVKKNGNPTGAKYDTTLSGAPYTASGSEKIGQCVVGCPPVSYEGVVTSW